MPRLTTLCPSRAETPSRRRLRLGLEILCAALLVMSVAPREAHAGGFFFTDRGTRPAGRGFAFVAGADDPQSLVYNPAGLAYSGQQLLLDVSFTWFRGEYTRVDSGGNVLPTVDLGTVPLPIPGLMYSHPLGEDFTMGVGLSAPSALLGDYPDGVRADGSTCDPATDQNCDAAPQRYALYSLDGSLIVQLDLALAWRPHPKISIGAGLGAMVGNFHADVALSACDNAICAQRENPDFDARTTMSLERFWDLAPHVGVILDFEKLRLGASFRFYPRGIQGTAEIRVRPPSDPFFDGAAVEGDRAKVDIPLPFVFRVGGELRFIPELRLEGALVYETWSRQEEISIRPQDVTLTNVTAIGDYSVGELGILRDMNDTISLRLGGELEVADGRLQLRAGVMFESSGFDDRTLTPMTIDSRKVAVGAGGSLRVGDSLFLDVAYSHIFLQNRNVTNSEVRQPNGIRPPLDGADAVYIGNGRYEWSADLFAVGLRYLFDGAGSAAADEPTEPVQYPSGLASEDWNAPTEGGQADTQADTREDTGITESAPDAEAPVEEVTTESE